MVFIKPFEVPSDGVKFQNSAVEALIDNNAHGKGNLFVTETNISWLSNDTGEGFKIDYKKMTLHAISRDPGLHSKDCLYIMVNGNTLDEDENFEIECPVELDEGEEELTEIRLVPDDAQLLDEMYKTIQDCSLLHPDASSDLSSKSNTLNWLPITVEDEEDVEEDPDELFEGYAVEEEDENVVNEVEENADESEGDAEAERLEQFIRMQLHFGNSNNGNQNGGHANGDEKPELGLSFVPEPGQFDDDHE